MSTSSEVKQAAEWTAGTVMEIAKQGFPHEACERIAWLHNAATAKLRGECVQLRQALQASKTEADKWRLLYYDGGQGR